MDFSTGLLRCRRRLPSASLLYSIPRTPLSDLHLMLAGGIARKANNGGGDGEVNGSLAVKESRGGIGNELMEAYMPHSMRVRHGRVLPDVRDGPKRVGRRILFSMHELGLSSRKPFRNRARVVELDFSLWCPLVQGHRHFGSIVADPPGSMHYTECRLDESRKKLGTANDGKLYDIAIVGGGMVGMALAGALSSMPLTKQLNVAIIDSNPALSSGLNIKKDDPPDPRVSTVTPANISFLKDVGAWQYIQQHRHAFFDQMQVWDYTGLGYTRYNARDVGKEMLGCVVENKVLHSALLSCLQNADFQMTIHPTRLTSMTLESYIPPMGSDSQSPEHRETSSGAPLYNGAIKQKHLGCLAKLQLDDGKSLYARLVVGADGSKSRIREISGIKTTGWNYSQNAVICTVEHAIDNHCACQRFLPYGPIALLPMGNRFSNIVWTLSPKEASDHKSMSEVEFVEAVNHALDYGYGPHPSPSFLDRYRDNFSWIAGVAMPSVHEFFQVPPKVIKLASGRMAFPLSLMHANDYASYRIVLIGDAAHTVHPLAGQGVNLGFEDAQALSKVIAEGISVGSDIGVLSLLKKYESERKPANILMMTILDGFQKAYSVGLGPLSFLRAAGFHGAQYFGPLKRNIISYATGEQKWPLFY